MRSAKAEVCLEDSFKIIASPNIGVEINVIIKELIKDANLVIRQRPKLELVFYTGYSRPFLVFVKILR